MKQYIRHHSCIYIWPVCVLQLSLVAFDDGVPEDRAETEISVTVRRNENPPTLPPNLGPYIISYEVRPGYVIVIVNATDGDGVSFLLCQVNSVIDAAPVGRWLCKPHKLLWLFSELSSLFVWGHRSCYYDYVYRCTEFTPWLMIMLIGSQLKAYYCSSPNTTTKECRLTWWIYVYITKFCCIISQIECQIHEPGHLTLYIDWKIQVIHFFHLSMNVHTVGGITYVFIISGHFDLHNWWWWDM